MRLSTDARMPQNGDMRALVTRLNEIHRDVANQLNGISEGALRASNNASPTMPAVGPYALGDFVRNSAPAELGTAGSKYVVFGWICLAAPATFVQQRFLTGN